MAKYAVFDELPPDINYEELARQAGYSEEDIKEMFGEPIDYLFFDNEKNTDNEEVDCNELNLSTPLNCFEDIPF